jgi:2-polyprenyl-3-methyl-5-hydroxy-6-metoxy-1,4-benzoquinol methylase
MRVNNCRNCNEKKLSKLFTLGNIYYTGKFSKKNQKIKKGPLELTVCNHCKLVQLAHKFDLKYMYGPDYGYRSNINHTMVKHLEKVVLTSSKKVGLKSGDMVLDIASNDGTLLNFYPNNVTTFGIDPLVNKYLKYYKKINYKISDFFSYKKIKNKTKNKFKIITALSVFYDLEKPNHFLNDVRNLLDVNGIFVLEFADLSSILKNNMFDTICHEHLEYYSSKVIYNMCKKNNLKIINIINNDINGSSKQFHISHGNSTHKVNFKKINDILKDEDKRKVNLKKTLLYFHKDILKIKTRLIDLLKKIKSKKQSIHAYGASTKGNVLLQYFGIDKKFIDFVAERNPKKFNLFTPGTNIKIISEKDSRKMRPNYYLVLPWHFKNEILKREKKIRSKGTKFIFPLPKLKII